MNKSYKEKLSTTILTHIPITLLLIPFQIVFWKCIIGFMGYFLIGPTAQLA